MERHTFSGKTFAGLSLLFVALPLVNWLAFGPLIPERTFLLISTLSEISSNSDPSNIIYYFARPLVHSVLGWIFLSPSAFLIAGFLFHSLFNGMVFSLAYFGIRRNMNGDPFEAVMAAAIITALVYPLALLSGVTGHGTTLIPHDAYHDFSFRTVFLVFAAASFIFLLRRGYKTALFLAAFSCYVHPTAGVLFLGLTILAIGPVFFSAKQTNLWRVTFVALTIGLWPGLSKMLFFEMPLELSESMNYGDWYSQLVKDEADDFSVLYQLIYFPLHTSRLMLAIIGVLFVYSRFFDNYKDHRSFWYAAAFPILFLLLAFAEYLFAVLKPSSLMYPIIALTPGYRILSLAFFPLVVLAARLIHQVLMQIHSLMIAARSSQSPQSPDSCQPRHFVQVASIMLITISMLVLLGAGVASGNFHRALAYGKWAMNAENVSGIEDYLRAAKISGADQYSEPEFYITGGIPLTYAHERNLRNIQRIDRHQPEKLDDDITNSRFSTEAFILLIEQVKSKIPEGEGLIVPPYLRYFRDALLRNPVFFQEHHDGNLMIGSPKFMRFWNIRMTELLGVTYEGMPSRYSGLSFSVMRERYLQLDQSKITLLHRKYPEYRYMITEIGHELEFQKVIQTVAYTVYDLSATD